MSPERSRLVRNPFFGSSDSLCSGREPEGLRRDVRTPPGFSVQTPPGSGPGPSRPRPGRLQSRPHGGRRAGTRGGCLAQARRAQRLRATAARPAGVGACTHAPRPYGFFQVSNQISISLQLSASFPRFIAGGAERSLRSIANQTRRAAGRAAATRSPIICAQGRRAPTE